MASTKNVQYCSFEVMENRRILSSESFGYPTGERSEPCFETERNGAKEITLFPQENGTHSPHLPNHQRLDVVIDQSR